jgi:type IV pilus assembly protein PilA
MNRQNLKDEQGFTLIELLVVILIIGILAAIAIPVFLGQQNKAHDTSAKANARSLLAHVETCAIDAQGDYSNCDDSQLTGTGLPLGSAAGQAETTAVSTTGFRIVAHSSSGTDWWVTRTSSGIQRCKNAPTCSPNDW